MNRNHKIMPLFTFFSSVVITIFLSGCSDVVESSGRSETQVTVLNISGQEQAVYRDFPATARASDLVDLSFRIPGELQVLDVKAGSFYKRGQLLAELDPSDYQRQVADTRSAYRLSKKNMQRARKLLPTQAISRSEFDEFTATYLIDKASLELAIQQLKYTKLYAPKDCRISSVATENFESVVAGQMVLQIEDPNTIDIEVQVSEKLAGNTGGNIAVRQNYRPDVIFTTLPDQVFKASYKEHETELDPKTKSYIYTLRLKKPDDKLLLPGMSATVRVNLSRIGIARSHMVLPGQSVLYRSTEDLEAGASFVWLYDPKTQTAVSRNVVVGELVQDGIEVISGIKANDQVIIKGGSRLSEGEKVSIKRERS